MRDGSIATFFFQNITNRSALAHLQKERDDSKTAVASRCNGVGTGEPVGSVHAELHSKHGLNYRRNAVIRSRCYAFYLQHILKNCV